MTVIALDHTDRLIVNRLQGGFPLSERPFADVAGDFGIGEDELIARVGRLAGEGALSRFGPMFNAERLGGAVTLCALAVPDERYEAVAEVINAFREVAHNYARDHELNMWFVIATERPEEVGDVIARIEGATGLEVFEFPKEREFFIGFRVEAQ